MKTAVNTGPLVAGNPQNHPRREPAQSRTQKGCRKGLTPVNLNSKKPVLCKCSEDYSGVLTAFLKCLNYAHGFGRTSFHGLFHPQMRPDVYIQ